LPVVARRDAAPRDELFAEHGRAAVADLAGDLLDMQRGCFQEFFGAAEPLAEQPGVRGCSGGRLEVPGERAAAHQSAGRKLVQG
jgi:hypothetical protein